MEYPERAAPTRRLANGAPRAVTIANDGTRVVFLRSAGPTDPADSIWLFDVESGQEQRIADPTVLIGGEASPGITGYATDPGARVAVFTLAGRLFRADLCNGDVAELPVTGTVVDPHPDPTSQRIAYICDHDGQPAGPGSRPSSRTWPARSATNTGKLRVVHPDGTDVLLAGEDGEITWGLAEPTAVRQFGRCQGYWWAPDGRAVLAARVDATRLPRWHLADPASPERPPSAIAYPCPGGPNAEVSLHLLDLDGGWVDVHWDRETYPYLVSVDWAECGPLITVLRRLQQHGLVLAIDPRTGETQVHAELADPRWVEPIPGTPCHLPDGRVLVGGELAHDGYDARCLFADGTLLTPASLYVRRVVGRLPGRQSSPDLLVEASEAEPSEQHLYRVRTTSGPGGVDAQRLTSVAGWHVAAVGGGILAVGTASLDHYGTRWSVWRGDTEIGTLRSHPTATPVAPRPALERVTDRRLPTAVLYPRAHVAGRRLPVLLDVHGGPGHQEVRAERSRWLVRQWWADTGLAVVTIDNRGTPGVAPSFEKVVHRRLADVILADQTDALASVADKHPDLDLDRVGIRGFRFGGWLAGLAVLRRPDLFRCGIAEAPITDWARYDAAYAERYLGLPEDGGEIYPHHSLVELAGEPPGAADLVRPLLLVHRMTDEVVLAAHTLRLSAALLAAGRPHSVIPLAAPGTPAANPDTATAGPGGHLLRLELEFLRQHI